MNKPFKTYQENDIKNEGAWMLLGLDSKH